MSNSTDVPKPEPSDRQVRILANEDWRFHAIGPVGTGVGMLATTERMSKVSKKVVSFGLPSAPALYLDIATAAHRRRSASNLASMFIEHSRVQGTWPEQHGPLFDYFEAFSTEVIFSYTAVEAFANESIPADFIFTSKRGKNGEVAYKGAEIERQVALSEKLNSVLPLAHKLTKPAGGKAWQDFRDLERVRDRLIHMKSIDRKASGPEHQTIWGLMLEHKATKYPLIAYRMIGAFPRLSHNRRWFEKAPSLDYPKD